MHNLEHCHKENWVKIRLLLHVTDYSDCIIVNCTIAMGLARARGRYSTITIVHN